MRCLFRHASYCLSHDVHDPFPRRTDRVVHVVGSHCWWSRRCRRSCDCHGDGRRRINTNSRSRRIRCSRSRSSGSSGSSRRVFNSVVLASCYSFAAPSTAMTEGNNVVVLWFFFHSKETNAMSRKVNKNTHVPIHTGQLGLPSAKVECRQRRGI